MSFIERSSLQKHQDRHIITDEQTTHTLCGLLLTRYNSSHVYTLIRWKSVAVRMLTWLLLSLDLFIILANTINLLSNCLLLFFLTF